MRLLLRGATLARELAAGLRVGTRTLGIGVQRCGVLRALLVFVEFIPRSVCAGRGRSDLSFCGHTGIVRSGGPKLLGGTLSERQGRAAEHALCPAVQRVRDPCRSCSRPGANYGAQAPSCARAWVPHAARPALAR